MRAFNLGMSIALTAIAALATADSARAADAPFRPPAMTEMKSQTTAGVTVGAKAYYSATEVKQAFGKLDPVKYGVLPVFVSIENKSDKSITLSGMKAVYVDIDRDRVEAMPVSEVRYANGPSKPNINPSPLPYPRKVKTKKNPLNDRIIEERGFAAKILPPGDSAHGFLYFDVVHRGGTTLLVSGLKQSATNEELFYFEVTLE